jgi:hypothetical protein
MSKWEQPGRGKDSRAPWGSWLINLEADHSLEGQDDVITGLSGTIMLTV